eukprot:764784-Hanusia_phi.AAC.1
MTGPLRHPSAHWSRSCSPPTLWPFNSLRFFSLLILQTRAVRSWEPWELTSARRDDFNTSAATGYDQIPVHRVERQAAFPSAPVSQRSQHLETCSACPCNVFTQSPCHPVIVEIGDG